MIITKVSKMLELSQSELKEILHYNPKTGVFTWIESNSNRVKIGDIAGHFHKSSGYIVIAINGKLCKSHRLAWLYMTGHVPKDCIDHINGDRSDNRFCNLREATQSQNNQNRIKAQKNNTTGYLGVTFHKATNKYLAKIRIGGKCEHLGIFTTPEEASKAYLAKKREKHEFCTI